MKHSLPLLMVVMMVVGCKPTVPSQYIQPDELEDLLYDYHLAESMAKNEFGENVDLRRNVYFQAVLKKHNVTEADFDSSLVYYYSHLDRLKDIYGNVNNRLAEEAKRQGTSVGDIAQYSQYKANGDTANIWTGLTDVLLLPRPTNNRYDFSVKADTTFRVGDSFMFQFVSEYLWQSGTQDAVVCICAHYENDSIQQVSTRASTNGPTQLNVPANNASKLKDLKGFIYLTNDDAQGDIRRLMFISQMQLIRFHSKDITQTPVADETTEQKDSVERVDNPRGEVADTASRRVGSGLRSKNAPFRKRRGAD